MIFFINSPLFPQEIISKIEFKNLKDGLDLDPYLEIREGDIFSEFKIKKSMENLFFSGYFKKIEVFKEKYGKNIKITFSLEPYPIIKKIKLNCKKCNKYKEYLKNNPFTEDLKERIENYLKEDLYNKGYFEPKIDFEMKDKILEINVLEGKRKKINAVSLNRGNFKELMDLKGKDYSKKLIEKKILRVENKYKKSYPLLKISFEGLKFVNGETLLKFDVKNFEKVEFLFEEKIKKRDRKKILKKITSETIGLDTIPFVLEEFKEELFSLGYKDAEVNFNLKEEKERKKFFIKIEKGKKYKIPSIKFLENKTFSEEELYQIVNFKKNTPYRKDIFREYKEILADFYKENGFFNIKIAGGEEFLKDGKVILNFKIIEGERYIPKNVKIIGFPEDLKLPEINLKEENPLKRSYVEKDLQNIQKTLNEAGYFYGKVSFNIKDEDFYYLIEPGEKYYINKVIFKGLYNIKLKEIKKEIRVKEGEPLSLRNLIDFQSNLFSTALFSSININPNFNYAEENQVDLKADLKESPPISIAYGIGYDSYDRFRINLNFSHINFLNKRYILGFEGRLYESQQLWRLSIKDPSFLNYNFPLFFGTYRSIERKPSFSLKKWGTLVEISRKYGLKSQATLRYEYQIQLPFKKDANFPLPKEEEEKKVSSIGLIYLSDKRDDIFFPKRGSFFSAEVKYSFPFLFADTNFLKFLLQYSYGISPLKKTTFAFSLRSGFIKNYKKEEVPIGERLFLGGRNTLRAYSRDYLGLEGDTIINGVPIGGKMSILFNLELRQFLGKKYGFNIFTDFGQVFSSYKKFNIGDLALGYGAGFFFLTPIGPLRLEYARKYEKVLWDDPYQWYVSLGFPF